MEIMNTSFLKRNSFLLAIVFVFLLSNLTVSSAYGQEEVTVSQENSFTIEKIEPSDKKDTVDLRFTANCPVYVFQDKLKVFPPVELSWSDSKMVNNTLTHSSQLKNIVKLSSNNLHY
jgi:hypothetical protein